MQTAFIHRPLISRCFHHPSTTSLTQHSLFPNYTHFTRDSDLDSGPQVVDGNREEADGDPSVRFLMITFHDLGPRDLEMIGCVLQFNLCVYSSEFRDAMVFIDVDYRTPISTCFRGSIGRAWTAAAAAAAMVSAAAAAAVRARPIELRV